MECTIVLPDLRCNQVNLIANEMVASATSPTALVGWAHALQRDVVASGFPVEFVGAAIAVEDFQLHRGHAKLTPEEGKESASIREDKTGSLTFALVLSARFDPDLVEEAMPEVEHERQPAILLDLARRAVLSSRFAGSPIFPGPGFAQAKVALDARSLRSALWPVRRSWLLVDRSDLLEGLDPAARLGRILDVAQIVEVKPEPPADKEGGKAKKEKEAKQAPRRARVYDGPGIVVPTMVGYQAIETPKDRPIGRNAPEGTRHVFAETLTSLGEFVAVSQRLRASAEAPLSDALWRPESDTRNGRFYATARN